jgi:periplasmic divalent cation tolerance protein
MPEHVQVLTTVGSAAEAERIAAALLDARLAACVQTVGPITSTYVWRGKREQTAEWQCLAKTERRLYPEVEAAIRAAHSYEEPEIVAIAVLAGSPGYLAWVSENVASAG